MIKIGGYVSYRKNENNFDKKVFFRIFLSIVLLIVVLFTTGLIKVFSRPIVRTVIKKESQETVKMSKELQVEIEKALLIYGVVYGNTEIIRDFCSETGYIPEEYINLFESSFYKTSQYMNEIFVELQKKYKINPIPYYKNRYKNEFIQVYEKDYELYKNYTNNEKVTKKSYCIMFDEMRDSLVSEKVTTFEEKNSNVFFDKGREQAKIIEKRYIKKEIPKNFLAEKQYPETELLFTLRWDLFNLYKFQNLPEEQRINAFENIEDEIDLVSDLLVGFVEPNQQYKIAPNYCISRKYNNGSYNLQKVDCKNFKLIDELPYKHCEWFRNIDEKGVYYIQYDLDRLWKEFELKGIDEVEAEIENEIIRYKRNNPV